MNDGSISTDLYQFFAAYFHQDWDLEADDWQGVVDIFINDDPVAEPLRTLAQEIDDLREARPEPDLAQFLVRSVGVNYLPEPLTYKEWLGQIADRLRQQAVAIENGSASSRRDRSSTNPLHLSGASPFVDARLRSVTFC